MQVFEIVRELESTNSRLEKEAILERNKNNEVLKQWFKMCLDPHLQFYQRKIPAYKQDTTAPAMDLSYAMGLLSVFSDRVVTGNMAINRLANILAQLDPEDAKMIERIIQKDPKCGVQESTVNKIWEKLIPEFPCLLASSYDAKLAATYDWDSGIIAQLKSDGMRVNVICRYGKVELRSRNGKHVDVLGHFDELANTFAGCMIDGELLVKRNGKILDRKTGNGICNKAVKGTISDEEASELVMSVWDLIPIDGFDNERCNTPYHIRLGHLQEKLKQDTSGKLFEIPTQYVYSYKEAKELYRKYVSEGQEGILIKKPEMIWENKRSKDQMKFKEELECDLQVVGFNHGKKGSKYEKFIGSLICRTLDDKLEVNVSGMSDPQRKDFSIVGKVVTVLFNEVIKDKKSETYSLFLPRIVEVREDKDLPDTFDDVMKVVEQSKQGI